MKHVTGHKGGIFPLLSLCVRISRIGSPPRLNYTLAPTRANDCTAPRFNVAFGSTLTNQKNVHAKVSRNAPLEKRCVSHVIIGDRII